MLLRLAHRVDPHQHDEFDAKVEAEFLEAQRNANDFV